jgi:hypothetical protein
MLGAVQTRIKMSLHFASEIISNGCQRYRLKHKGKHPPCEIGNETYPVRVLRSSQDLHIQHGSEVYGETTGHSRRLGMPKRWS